MAAFIAAWSVWCYTSPQEPRIPTQNTSQEPTRDYQPGGAHCSPKALAALPTKKRTDQRERCAEASEDHRIKQEEIAQSSLANELAVWNLRLAHQQARSGAVQAVATVLAFIAAAIAAFIAWRGMYWAAMAARHTKDSADSAKAQVDVARLGQRPYLFVQPISINSFDWLEQRQHLQSFIRVDNYGTTPAILRSILVISTVSRDIPQIIKDDSESSESYTVTLNFDVPEELVEDARIWIPVKPEAESGKVIAPGDSMASIPAKQWQRAPLAIMENESPTRKAYLERLYHMTKCGETFFRIFGWVRYEDASGKPHETKFCFRMDSAYYQQPNQWAPNESRVIRSSADDSRRQTFSEDGGREWNRLT